MIPSDVSGRISLNGKSVIVDRKKNNSYMREWSKSNPYIRAYRTKHMAAKRRRYKWLYQRGKIKYDSIPKSYREYLKK